MHPTSPFSLTFTSAEHLLAAIVDSSDDAVVSKDLNGVITSWNKSAERIFGWTAAEAIGKSVTMLIPPDRIDEETVILGKLRKGERVEHFETVRVRKDGRLFNVSLTISPVKDSSGTVVGASKIARDITEHTQYVAELKRLQEEAVVSAREAERQSRIKDEFLATLSHELRTPLQSILGWTQLLRSGTPAPEEIVEGMEVIEKNASAQARIVEDLLDMNRIVSGKVRLDVQPVNLSTVIAEAVDSVKPAAQAKGLRLEVIVDPFARPVNGDPARMQQIFWNLLTNAIKFTPRGGKVQVVLERVNSHLEVSVSDTGEGISPDFLPFVFDRFRQADASTTRTYGGLGLGLAIVKHLSELHGGSVRVKSHGEGQGSCFTVQLPLPVIDQSDKDAFRHHPVGSSPVTRDPAYPDLKGISILLVDDEADARALLVKVLVRAGAKVDQASSVEQALTLIREAHPDVIISDIGMPQQDGYALIRAVRKLPLDQGGAVPAIALTAYTRTEDRIRTLNEGFQMHIAKPADVVELLTAVAGIAAHGRREAARSGGSA
ncbi:MAG TPA: ATP-binding protein [Verrucomicrobiales bacterium]|jgi:PAS domain S-box-containing protein|nr:ATP-binding protein [Verrucomicrobiales bacterium]